MHARLSEHPHLVQHEHDCGHDEEAAEDEAQRALGHETHEAGGTSTGEGPPASFMPKNRRI